MDEEKPKQVTSLETLLQDQIFRKFISDLYYIKDNLTVVDDYCLFSSELPFTTVDIYSDASYPSIHYSDDENEVVLVIILSSIYYIQIAFQIFVQNKEDLWVNFLEPCLSISKI